jgi:hypothetical protein
MTATAHHEQQDRDERNPDGPSQAWWQTKSGHVTIIIDIQIRSPFPSVSSAAPSK